MGWTIVCLLLVVCPWPADNRHYSGSNYQTETLSNLIEKKIDASNASNLLAGIAEIDISPPVGHPLAGYQARELKQYTDIQSRCYGRALTLAQDSRRITILAADLLTIHRSVAKAILDKAQLSADEVYFTASHTHGGPGGYVDRFLEEIVLGKYNAKYVDDLTTKLAELIKRSRRELVQVEVGILKTDASRLIINRIDKRMQAYGKLTALVFREMDEMSADVVKKPLAVLVSFGAHPTIIGRHQYHLSSGYPGALVEQLKQLTGAKLVLFAAGALGDASPKINKPKDRFERSREYGKILAHTLAQKWGEVKYEQEPVMRNNRLTVVMPPFRVTMGSRWRHSPILTTWFFDRRSHIHVLQINNTVLAGFPGDYAGDLAFTLDKWFLKRGLELVPTSFNGDWLGYLASSESFFNYSNYEVRDMNFYGPWAGEYLNDLVKYVVRHQNPEVHNK